MSEGEDVIVCFVNIGGNVEHNCLNVFFLHNSLFILLQCTQSEKGGNGV